MAKNKEPYDFSGWATKANLKCSDGRIIMHDAFKDNDGQTVPLVWNHDHNDPYNVLGHATLENRGDGVYVYGYFNSTEKAEVAKKLIQHGDIDALSIYANKLKQRGACVIHGDIKEVSLVLAGANPGACVDMIMAHGEETEDEAIIYAGEKLELFHSEQVNGKPEGTLEHSEKPKSEENKEDSMAETEKKPETTKPESEETVQDVVNSMTEKQKTVMYGLIGRALYGEGGEEDKEDNTVKHNLFDNDTKQGAYLSHADEVNIINLAKTSSVGSLREAINIYAEENGGELAHGFEAGSIEQLFPDYTNVPSGAPELITDDQSWVDNVIGKCTKSPIARIRTRQFDARGEDLRAYGYVKGKKKQNTGNLKLLKRTTDPQTVYVKDKLERDDIVDIEDFDVVLFQYQFMRSLLNEELATAILIGDGREDGDEQKINEEHIRSIWHDDDLYTIHTDVDIAAAKSKLQGSNTAASFGNNYIYAEAIIEASLYAREQYKGSGALDLYCTPHLLNVMLLARDLNGRRIYDSKSDLAAALNVGNIYTVEQFEGKTRTTKDNKTKKLLGLFVNMKDYRVGSAKGGEVTRFDQFDIDFNQYKYLMETRVSGALTKAYSAIALEEPVAVSGDDDVA